jgi:eukaryotic-like serine/threonine-protein kinase
MDRVLNGRYRLGPKIGDGGMALVYRGLDVRLGRTVAIKVLREQWAADPSFVARFDREAQAVAALNHPNIIGIFDVGSDFDEDGTDRPFFVMEFIDGPNLKEWIRAHAPLPVDETVAIATQMLAGLGYAHARALVHRDIKPQNIMLSQDGTVKVTDFGIAKGLGDAALTDAGTGLGTVHYISPEQARGEPASPASDLYAVGIVLYEMLTGYLPFTGDTQVGVAMQHVHDQPTPPRQLNPEIPAPLSALVLRALAKEPNARFLSARMMAQVLADWPNFREQPARAAAAVQGRAPVAAARTAVMPNRAVAANPPGRVPRRHEAPTLADRPRPTQPAVRRPAQPPPPVSRQRNDGIGCATWAAGAFVLVMLLAVLVVGYKLSPFGARAAEPTEPPVAVVPPGSTDTPATATSEPATATLVPTSTPFTLPAAGITPTTRPSATLTAPPPTRVAASPTLAPTEPPTETATVTVTPKPSPTGTATAVTVAVPNLIGKTLSQAQGAAKEAGFVAEQIEARYSDQPAGTVIEQRPGAGSRAAKGTTIGVVISRGLQTVALPDLKGQSYERASGTLRDLGLVAERKDVPSRNVAQGLVIDQDPLGGNDVSPGSTVTLTVSLGDVVAVPDLFGLNFEQARKQLIDAGFVVNVNGQTKDQINKENPAFFTVNPGVQDGQVISQSLPAGSYQQRGAVIAIAYYKAK